MDLRENCGCLRLPASLGDMLSFRFHIKRMRRPSDTYDVPRKCKHITQLTDTYYFVSMFDVVVAYLQQVQFAPLFAPP